MAESSVPFLSVPRLVEVNDDKVASPSSNEINSAAVSPADGEHENWSDERPEPSVVATHQRNEPRNSIASRNMHPVSPTRLEPPFMSQLPDTSYSNFGAQVITWASYV
jgi:hypothetical protein